MAPPGAGFFTRLSYSMPLLTDVGPAALWRAARSLRSGLLHLVYPPLCLGCAARVEGEAPLCPRCLSRLERADTRAVQAQLDRLPDSLPSPRGVGPALDAAFVAWHFDKGGTLQRVQHALKYGNRPRYGLALGTLAGAAYAKAGFGRPTWVLPIPLHRTRYLERGYNQSATLAAGAARALGTDVREDLLVRRRATPSQTSFKRADRWGNVYGAFATPRPDVLAGRRLLLVDDVLTTGATAAAAAHALKAAGAAEVNLLALALARS